MTGPALSVVVATYGRSGRLRRLAEAILAQEPAGSVELIVVDDASRDDTAAVLDGLAAELPGLRALHQERNAGPAAARNLGWRVASADLIAFTDDDCVPQPGWAAAMTRSLACADLVQGTTLPDPEQLHLIGPFSRTLEVTSPTGYYQTCNMGYRRALLEQLGGFDERFADPAGEDTDLAWRALDAGARAAFEPGALVYHDVRPSSFSAHVRDLRRWRSVVLATRKHPGLRDHYHRRWIWRASHGPAIAGVAGLALCSGWPLGRRRWAGLVLLVPYAWFRTRVQPLPGSRRQRLAAVPAAFVADAIEVGVLVGASVRYRTPLL